MMALIKLMLITNQPETAKQAVDAGVERIFVDMEINGKFERQGHLSTVISGHSLTDVRNVRAAIPNSELLVRVNPLYEGSKEEVDGAIEAGADILMLPMFRDKEDVEHFCNLVGDRCKVMPLVETPQAMVRFDEIVQVEGVSEIYIGLNDLHLALGLDFMFELLSSGLVDYMAQLAKAKGLPFGFGGIARLGEGLVPGEVILSEHVRLGAKAAILSRSFHDNYSKINNLSCIVKELREAERHYELRSGTQILKDRDNARRLIREAAVRIKRGKART